MNSNVETRTMCVISTSFECNPREREREKKGARLKYSRRRFRTGPSESQGDILRRLAESRKSSWVPGEDSRAKERGRERDEGGVSGAAAMGTEAVVCFESHVGGGAVWRQ